MASKSKDMQPLHAACSEGCLKKVKTLIETEQKDPYKPDLNKVIPIQLAVEKGHLHIVKYMIEFKKFDVSKNLTPYKSYINGYVSIGNTTREMMVGMKVAIAVNTVCIARYSFQPWTLLHEACRWDQLEIIGYLVFECNSNPYGGGGRISPLDTACFFGNLKAVKYIFSQVPYNGLFIHVENVQIQISETLFLSMPIAKPLHAVKHQSSCFAAAGGCVDVLKYFATELKVDVCSTLLNMNPLHMCCLNSGNVDVLKYLSGPSNMKDQRINSFSCLHGAAVVGNLEAVKYLLEKEDFDPRDCDTLGRNILHLAAMFGQHQIIQYCIDSGYNPPEEDEGKGTPLHIACGNGYVKAVRCLSIANDSALKCKMQHDMTPFLCACSAGHADVVRYLIEEFHCVIDDHNIHGLNGLHLACASGHIDIVEMLCARTKDLIKQRDFLENTALMYAAKCGHIKIIRYLLLSKECSINNKNKQNLSAYDLAKQNNHQNVCKLLEVPLDQYCVSMDCPNPFGCHELRKTCANGDKSAALSLIRNKALRPQCMDSSGKNSLHYASQGGQLEIVKYLVESKACDPASIDHMKQTALHHACTSGSLDTVKYLTQYNEVDQCNKMGQNSLHSACTGGSTATDIIENQLCDIKCIDGEGRTCFHLSCLGGHLPLIEYFLTLEPHVQERDIMLKDTCGNTPLHYACQNDHLEIVKVFLTNNETRIDVTNNNCQFPHDMAWEKKHYSIVLFIVGLCKQNCDIRNLRSSNGFNLAHCACEQSDLELLKYLIEGNIFNPLHPTLHGMNGLHFACMNRNGISVVRVLALTDKTLPQVKDSRGYTPLHYACQNGCKETVEFLLKECQCNIDLSTKCDDTPLHIATRCNHLDIVSMLLSFGCNSEIRNNRNHTPHDIAEKRHYDNIAMRIRHYFKEYCDVESYIKVFVVGDHDNGKSTLCRNLQESVGLFQSLLPVFQCFQCCTEYCWCRATYDDK